MIRKAFVALTSAGLLWAATPAWADEASTTKSQASDQDMSIGEATDNLVEDSKKAGDAAYEGAKDAGNAVVEGAKDAADWTEETVKEATD